MDVVNSLKNRISWWYNLVSLKTFYTILFVIVVLYLLWLFFGNKVKCTVDEYSKAFGDVLDQFKQENLIKPVESEVKNNANNIQNNANNIQNNANNIQNNANNNNSTNKENIKIMEEYEEDDENEELPYKNKNKKSMIKGNSNINNNNNNNNNKPENLQFMNFMPNYGKPKQKLCYEDECHRILEEITGRKFYKNVRPPFLKNPVTSRNLELDCYDGGNIALEYQGIQHYKYPNPYHRSEKEFEYQVQKDKWKFDRCEENDVFLIRVPYTIPFRKLKSYIQSRLSVYHEEKSEVDRTSCYA
jgi:hypothetical protein